MRGLELTTEIRAEPAGRKPSALRALSPPVNTCFVLSCLHPLKSWSLRETRGGSVRQSHAGWSLEFMEGKLDVALRSRWLAAWVLLSRFLRVIGRRGDREHPADRLDPVTLTVRVDEQHLHFGRRSSSAWAKNADALRRISFARFSSRFFSLKLLQPLMLVRRQFRSFPSITLCSPHPRA